MRNHLAICAAAFAAAAIPGMAAAGTAADALPGARIYQTRCTACHSLDANRIGPAHRGVFGRAAGSAPGYAYSSALKGSGIVWNEHTLDQWLQGPQKLVRGTKMFFSLPDPADRVAVIAFLKATSGK